MIVVGIYNTTDRYKEYATGEQGDRYIKFVNTKLKPMIDRTYRVNRDATSTAVAGSSMGGLCAFRMAWEHPELYSAAICMSPTFKYEKDDGSVRLDYAPTLQESETPKSVPFFYIDNGGIGLDKILQPGVNEVIAALKKRGLEEGKNFVWKRFPNDHHSEPAWAARMPAALSLLFKERSISE